MEFTLWPFPSEAIVFLAIGTSLLVSLVAKRFILGRLIKLIDRTDFYFDSLVVRSLGFPLTICVWVLNLMLFNQLLVFYEIASTKLSSVTTMLAQIMLVVAVVSFTDRLIGGAIGHYSRRSPVLLNSQSIIQGVARGVVVGIGVLILLSTLGISITPILASLGITSLAVALALQPTLENFFSGVQLIMDKPVRVGDYIELESGEQGFVDKIGWRSTWVKMLPNNTVIVPNSVLSQSKIINYYYPEKELSVPVEVGVHYSSDLEHVERVTLEVAREILRTHKWGVSDYETFLLFHTFDSSSINFTVMLRVQEYFNRFFVKSAFIKALHARYALEGIVIPYPIRAINTQQEGAQIKI